MGRTRDELRNAVVKAVKLDVEDSDLKEVVSAMVGVSNAVDYQAIAVQQARKNGKSWQDIAKVMGVSRQTIERQYR